MSRTHLNAVRIRTEERGYIALYNAEQENYLITRPRLLHKVKIIL